MKYNTIELEGALLDAAVSKAMYGDRADEILAVLSSGLTADGFYPSSNWSHGGPIIEREKITIRSREANAVSSTDYWAAMKDADSPQPGSHFWMVGSTALIAAMRAFVTAKLGAEVDL